MGAQSFVVKAKGKSAQKAFDELVEDAQWQYGHDAYNGTISTTQLRRRTALLYATPDDDLVNKAYEMIREKDYGDKWSCDYIEIVPVAKNEEHTFLFYGWASC